MIQTSISVSGTTDPISASLRDQLTRMLSQLPAPMASELTDLLNRGEAALETSTSLASLDEVRVLFWGKKGEMTALSKQLGRVEPAVRPIYAQALTMVRNHLEQRWHHHHQDYKNQALAKRLRDETVDMTLSLPAAEEGTLHPVSHMRQTLVAFFTAQGFQMVDGPDIETETHNFTHLNMPPHHPACQDIDTFYLDEAPLDQENKPTPHGHGPRNERGPNGRFLLRTHTSPVQLWAMRHQGAPLRMISLGRVYRRDHDATHTPMFHQIEGLVVEKSLHMGHLKGCLLDFCQSFFGVDADGIRLRPSYFPFTEPSVEVDMRYHRVGDVLHLGRGDQWLEILGAGMVHPTVLRHGGLDPQVHQGFAFGMGVERLTMLKYGMADLRCFYEGDMRWLRHYGFGPLTPVWTPTTSGIPPYRLADALGLDHAQKVSKTPELSDHRSFHKETYRPLDKETCP